MCNKRRVSEDRLCNNKRLKTSVNNDGRENSFPISMDLLIEIFSKLPVKSIATCRHVSKYWAYVLSHPDFTELFLSKSSARPQILCGNDNNNGFLFFSSHQPQNLDDGGSSSSPIITAYPLTHVPGSCDFSRPVNGMVCLSGERILKGTVIDVSVIYNPSTGEFVTLPETKTKTTSGMSFRWRSYLGYDPIKKQYKVLSMAYQKNDQNRYRKYEKCVEFQVLTLGTGKLTWKVVEKCCISHFPPAAHSGLCINGVLYYLAEVKDSAGVTMSVVSFDFRSDKFNVLKFTESFTLSHTTAFINYDGKLGVLLADEYSRERSTSFELWILQDLVKHEWSKHIYELPPLLLDDYLHFDGMIGTDETVLLPSVVRDVPHVLYHNIKRKTIIRVEIKGIKPFKVRGSHIFLNHVENVKLIRA